MESSPVHRCHLSRRRCHCLQRHASTNMFSRSPPSLSLPVDLQVTMLHHALLHSAEPHAACLTTLHYTSREFCMLHPHGTLDLVEVHNSALVVVEGVEGLPEREPASMFLRVVLFGSCGCMQRETTRIARHVMASRCVTSRTYTICRIKPYHSIESQSLPPGTCHNTGRFVVRFWSRAEATNS